MEFSHYSVMLPQCMEGLHIKPDGTYIDGTAGGAGHSKAIAERLTTGRLLSFDRDPMRWRKPPNGWHPTHRPR